MSETRAHSTNSVSLTCQSCKNQFVIEPDDFDFYKKIEVPPPTRCPKCRLQRRLAFRGERSLYRRSCSLTGESVVSLYSEDAPFPVYSQKAWWSDKWDPMTYGREFNFSQPFFEQFAEFFKAVPRLSLMNKHCVNSDYCPWSIYYKNSFLCVSGNTSEDCYYDFFVIRSKDVFDSAYTEDSELCYECADCKNLYGSAWCTQCVSCSNVWFSEQCVNCTNCFGCVGLRNKEHYLFNKPLSKEEWEREVEKLKSNLPGNLSEINGHLRHLRLSLPQRFAYTIKCTNCIGDRLLNSKNSKYCYDATNLEDCRYITNSDFIKDSYDVNFFIKSERCYEGLSLPNSYNTFFSIVCWDNRDVYYSDHCFDSNNLFGCIGMRKSSYCILNKQYKPEEYNQLLEKIIDHMKSTGEWGEFFPVKLSPFGYDESTAPDYFPLTKEEAAQKGFAWAGRASGLFGKETTTWDRIPQQIDKVDDSITKEILICEKCKKNFRILAQELGFYKRMRIPLPRYCPDCRHEERLGKRNPRELWHRKCQCSGKTSENNIYQNTATHQHGIGKCPNEFETSYSPERKEIVYCESCYNSEIV